MSRKMKKMMPVLVLLLVLAALTVVYIVVKNRPEEETEDETIPITNISSDDLTGFTYTYEDVTIGFVKNDDGDWVMDGEEEFPLDASTVEAMADMFFGLTADYMVEGTDPADYGLDEPEVILTATTADGTIELKVGDAYPYGTERYVSTDQTGDTVYVTDDDIYSEFIKSRYDLFEQKELPSFASTDVTSIVLMSDSMGSYDLYWQEDESAEAADMTADADADTAAETEGETADTAADTTESTDDDSEAEEAAPAGEWILLTQQGEYTCEADDIAVLLAAAADIEYEYIVDYREEKLADYGITDDSDILFIFYEYEESTETEVTDEETGETTTETTTETLSASIKFYFGDVTDDGYQYINVDGSSYVFAVFADELENFVIEDPEAYGSAKETE